MRERYFSILPCAILILLVLVSGCRKSSSGAVPPGGNGPSDPVDFDLHKILVRGKIVGILENSSTGYFIYKGQTMGYEYDLLRNLADYLDVELELRITTSIVDAFDMLDRGEGDIIAYPLTITKERKNRVMFTDYQYTVHQVLVQPLPLNAQMLRAHEIEARLIRNQVDLIGKEVHVRFQSSYLPRLHNLSEEIGGDIVIVEAAPDLETEDLIRMVSEGQIDYTVSDEDVALVNAAYYPNIDVNTPVSFPTQISWGVRRNAPDLRDTINSWLKKIQREPTFNVIYRKYFKNPRASLVRSQSGFSSIGGGQISRFDPLIKDQALRIQWDWRLLAAQIYQESSFNPQARSWAGAMGLMQLVPATAKAYGARNPLDPVQSVTAGVNYLEWIEDFWEERLPPDEAVKFTLASYNVGLGHVIDARRLAEKYGSDPNKWNDQVEVYLRLKSRPKYYNDPVVTSGYCRGDEPVQYVKKILSRYDQYKQHFDEDPRMESEVLSKR